MFDFIFYSKYVINSVLLVFIVSLYVLYYLQLDEYNIKSILKSLMYSLRDNYIVIFLYVVILCVMKNPNSFNNLFLIILLDVSVVVLVLLSRRFKNLFDIKYTKRMCRLIVCILVYYVIFESILLSILSKWILVVFLPLQLLLAYLIIYLSLLTMMPIEKLIANHYIDLARSKLSQNKKLTKIAITGSYGKTSTKCILNSILSNHFSTVATDKSFNTPMGICLTINNKLKSTHEMFVCEMGARKNGEIKELCDIVNPDIGVVVSVGRQHMQTFRDINNVYLTKKELPDSLINKKCVFNLDNYFVKKMYEEFGGEKIGVFLIKRKKVLNHISKIKKKNMFKKASSSKSGIFAFYQKLNNLYAKNIESTENGSVFDVYFSNIYLFRIITSLFGVHNITNILLAIVVAKMVGVPYEKIVLGVAQVKSITARLEKKVCGKGAILLNNGYNSNIDSAKHTLESLSLFDRNNKVVITPGLVECKDQYGDNKKFGEMLSKYATKVYIVGGVNLKGIKEGLKDGGFSDNNIIYLPYMKDAYKVIDSANEDYVFLIENDLPDNYR